MVYPVMFELFEQGSSHSISTKFYVEFKIRILFTSSGLSWKFAIVTSLSFAWYWCNISASYLFICRRFNSYSMACSSISSSSFCSCSSLESSN